LKVGYVFCACSIDLPIADGAWVICMTLSVMYVVHSIQMAWNQPFKRNKFRCRRGSCSKFYSRSWRGNRVMVKVMTSRHKIKMKDWTPRSRPVYSVRDDEYHELREFYRSNGYREPANPSKVMTAVQYSQYLQIHGRDITIPADCSVSPDISDAFVQVPVDCCRRCSTDVSEISDEWCFSASKDDVNSPIRYNSDSFQIAIDNCATSCFTNSMEDFIGTPRIRHRLWCF
jgi:hypothetical protein